MNKPPSDESIDLAEGIIKKCLGVVDLRSAATGTDSLLPVASIIQSALDAARDEAKREQREADVRIAETKYAATEFGSWDAGYVNAGLGIAASIRKGEG